MDTLTKELERKSKRELYREKNLSKMQKQEYVRQERRRGKIARAEMYWKMRFQFPSKHIPANSISGFEESVIEAGKKRALKWFNG